jgi:hypothetical protein
MTTVLECLRQIQVRIETIAETESRSGETGVSLEETLAALTEPGRRRVMMLLDRIRAVSNDPNERSAADIMRRRAARVWYGEFITFAGGTGLGTAQASAQGKDDDPR